jgi:hypothetical protein
MRVAESESDCSLAATKKNGTSVAACPVVAERRQK